MGGEGGPVNHPGGVELAVRALVLEAKASRLSKSSCTVETVSSRPVTVLNWMSILGP